MNDKEIFTDLLTRAGFQFDEEPIPAGDDRFPAECVSIEVGNHQALPSTEFKKNGIGYSGFVSQWVFDSGGKLVAVGHYE